MNMKVLINNKEFNLIKANTFFKRLKGLMFKKNITTGMFFPNCNSIHTFFMFDKIDIIMIDNCNKIVYLEKNVKRKIIYKKEARHTIELPKNSICEIKINDQLVFKD